MKRISIISPCYNEKDNIEDLYTQVVAIMESLSDYQFELIFIDNASTDGTIPVLRNIAARDERVKVILNNRNFGHIRSPYYGLQQAYGDAVILMASDLQDPPALISQFIKKWEEGYKVVLGVKIHSQETPIFYALRTLYYRTLKALSETPLVEHATGFGLFDQEVIILLRQLVDPYPYFRGLIAELGYERAVVPYDQPKRKRGITKNNFYTLYDMAMLGMTNHSRVPLRLATMLGFAVAFFSFLVGMFYLVYKLIYWDNFVLGSAPIVIGLFFFSAIQLFFLGIVGEYIGALYTQVLNRPLVVEKERINFDS